METRDSSIGDSASSSQLQTLLQSLRIGVSSQDDGLDGKKDTSAPPSLPLADQLRLVSAHIDSLQSSIAKSVQSTQSIEQIRRQTTSSLDVRSRLDNVQTDLQGLEHGHDAMDGELRAAVLHSLAQYTQARQTLAREQQAARVGPLLLEAAQAVEALEERISSGQVDPEGLAKAIAMAKTSCAVFGVRALAAGKAIDADITSSEFSWLGNSATSPPAIRQLRDRLQAALARTPELLRDFWSAAVQVKFSDGDKYLHLSISPVAHITSTEPETVEVSLSTLLVTLHSRSELFPLITSLSQTLIKDVVSTILRPNTDKRDATSWSSAVSEGPTWTASRQHSLDVQATLATITSMLVYLKQHLFAVADQTVPELQFEFSRQFVPALVPALVAFLRNSLPDKLQRPITVDTLEELSKGSAQAQQLHDALNLNGYLTRGLIAEAEPLLDFAQNTGRFFLRQLATSVRAQCRNLLLKETSGGWEGVEIEMEVQLPPSQTVKDAAAAGHRQRDMAGLSDERAKFQSESEHDEDAWSAWDDANEQKATEPAIPSSASGTFDAHTSLFNRSNLLPPDRSVSPAGSGYSETSQPGRAKAHKKSALGGVRVIKPADQLGSGPFPGQDGIPDDSWGFDDEPVLPATTSSVPQRVPSGSVPAPVVLEDEDDAWFQDDEPMPAAAVSLHHASAPLADSSTSSLPAPTALDDDDDAWFQEELVPPSVQASSLRAASPIRNAPPAPPAAKDEEDAWFQEDSSTEAAPAKDTSTHTTSSAFSSAVLLDASELEEDIDEDAWGLTEEEKVERAAKRASMRASRGGPDLASAFKAFAEKQATAAMATDDTPPTKAGLNDVVEEAESEQAASAKEVADVGNLPAHTQTAPDTPKAEVSRNLAHTVLSSSSFGLDAALPEDDDEDDAWGLSEQEKEALAIKRQSRLFTAPPASAFSSHVQSADCEAPRPSTDSDLDGPAGDESYDMSFTRTSANLDVFSDDASFVADQRGISTPESQQRHLSPVGKVALLPTTRDTTQKVAAVSEPPVPSAPLAEQPPPPPTSKKEACMVSQRSISFIKLASSLLDDILAVAERNGQSNASSQGIVLDAKYLIEALNDVLDLHRALMPVGHAETLSNVPTLAAQFANDCSYIARELAALDESWKGAIHSRPALTSIAETHSLSLEQHARLTGLLGQRSFDAQMLVQQRVLAECLADVQGFEATYDEARFQACQRGMRQVVVVIQQLGKAWKPVLTPSYYLAAMGRLIDSVLRRVLRDVCSLEDISEVEGEKLSALVKSLDELESIFRAQESEHSDVAIHVPSWFKASYLSEILTGSLVDIEFLYFEAGALVDYSKEELVSLIRSLFSDTPKRSRLLERIQSS